VKDQDLHELFEAFGEVTSAKIIMDKATNRSRGFGFVEMANDEPVVRPSKAPMGRTSTAATWW
jgi:RNA recognition motif-containing protein